MKKQLYILLTIFAFFCSCKGKCDDTRDIFTARDTMLDLIFTDANTGANLIKDTNSLYTKADVSVKNQALKALNFTFTKLKESNSNTETYYKVSIRFFEEEYPPVGAVLSKRIFIDLNTDRDTIDYDIRTKNGPCAPVIDQLKIWYNGKIVNERSEQTDILLNIKK